MQYFSKKVTPNNFGALQKILSEHDKTGSGFLSNDEFVRCLSSSQMKVTESEVEALVSELDVTKTGRVNYEEFLKYSYLCQMYIQHLNLEYTLNLLDTEHKGLITVSQLDEIL